MAGMDGKVVVVTGAARGVGFGIAQEMAAAGARVVMTDLSQEDVEAAAAQVGSGARGLTADVTQLASMEAMYAEVMRLCGRLDVVVANAGVGDGAALGSITEAQFDFITGVNLKGVLFTVQAALPHLKPGGTAVIIGSTASIQAQQELSVYGATKAGLRMFVCTWIQGLKRSGIRINMLSPGAIDTPSLRKALADASGPENVNANVKWTGEGNPLGRLGDPGEIGKAAVFVSSNHSSFITGVELFADGGVAQSG
jgi:NAD(P)-dependent dehydrogenase (short-subunit alcohol dehydrogenase family)